MNGRTAKLLNRWSSLQEKPSQASRAAKRMWYSANKRERTSLRRSFRRDVNNLSRGISS